MIVASSPGGRVAGWARGAVLGGVVLGREGVDVVVEPSLPVALNEDEVDPSNEALELVD